MEEKMISYAVKLGLRYNDYYVSRSGHIRFQCLDKKKKERWFTVESWSPFVCKPIV